MLAALGKVIFVTLVMIGTTVIVFVLMVVIFFIYLFYKKSNETFVDERHVRISRTIGFKRSIWYETIDNFESIGEMDMFKSMLAFERNRIRRVLWEIVYVHLDFRVKTKMKISCISDNYFIVQSTANPIPVVMSKKEFEESEFYSLYERVEGLYKFVKTKVKPIIEKERASRK